MHVCDPSTQEVFGRRIIHQELSFSKLKNKIKYKGRDIVGLLRRAWQPTAVSGHLGGRGRRIRSSFYFGDGTLLCSPGWPGTV